MMIPASSAVGTTVWLNLKKTNPVSSSKPISTKSGGFVSIDTVSLTPAGSKVYIGLGTVKVPIQMDGRTTPIGVPPSKSVAIGANSAAAPFAESRRAPAIVAAVSVVRAMVIS